jgi:hypothetical protein
MKSRPINKRIETIYYSYFGNFKRIKNGKIEYYDGPNWEPSCYNIMNVKNFGEVVSKEAVERVLGIKIP